MSTTCFSRQPYLGINLEMSAERLTTFFSDEQGQLPAELRFLVQGNDWQINRQKVRFAGMSPFRS